ncbi:uncharacterized protein LOC101240101 isoform X2 [Hydra vulgaris]|uniref:uncharacterized protein LOC101240101 isoform X2 n=1 Tax=Hydra vulgaris TaxID=6087 RepID=UPI001F5F28E0|nr:uncharacterized protein LOC101240101 isoform X2 [Hydra vulgaris]XP_047136284.1 uncharacterized protein LOC101240101 isoform X2 [Hydra vulgaris]
MENLLREKQISVFPTMDSQEVTKVINGLLLLGLEMEGDLKYLKEQDLITLLPPIKSRRFLSVCQPVELLLTNGPSSLSLISPEPSNSSIITSSDWAQSFIVNWEKFPLDFLKDLNNKKKPTVSNIRQMVGLLMSDVFLFDRKPSRQNLRIIAQKVVSRFPDSFVDEINGKVISNGVETLMFRMESRKENANRNVSFSSTPVILTKRMNLNVHSIENWDPNLSSQSVELINIKEQPQQTYRILPWNTNDVKKFMSDTYSLQRQTINAVIPFAEVLIEWPFLSQIEYLQDHFSTLMNFSLMERLNSTISTKSSLIYNFFSINCSKDLVKQVLLEATVICMENGGIARAVCLAWLPLLIAYFGDKTDHLIQSVNRLASIQEIEENCPTSHPIIVVKGTWLDSENFYILVEKKVCYTFTDALPAIGALFAVHYVMNMQYHPNVFASLEFIQRFTKFINVIFLLTSDYNDYFYWHLAPTMAKN